LKKFREKIKDHHKKDYRKVTKAKEASLEEVALTYTPPKIVRSKASLPKPMSVEEASLQLEISDEPFLMYLNASTNRPSVIFKRKDGNHGLIETR